jgi:hypothetical protein
VQEDIAAVAIAGFVAINVFELDELIHYYNKCAPELWKFCSLTGGDPVRALRTLEFLREQGEAPPDWWAVGEDPRRRR